MNINHPSEPVSTSFSPNLWDLVAFLLIIVLFVLTAEGAHQMFAPLAAIEITPISLDPSYLPGYSLRTVLRMLAALLVSLTFTFTYATLAAKSRRAEMILIPLLDILQSVPVLGFISFTVVFFMRLFPGNVMGAECAAIFAIFTSQAWNMAFSFYQSLRALPNELIEASQIFRLSAWQKFWRLEVPFAAPSLVWNMMMSMSGGWFFVVASEAITVGNTTVTLPGVGSYVALAIAQKDLYAVGYAIIAMLLVILICDQILFRPLVAWAQKFRFEHTASSGGSEPLISGIFMRTRLVRAIAEQMTRLGRKILRWRFLPEDAFANMKSSPGMQRVANNLWVVFVALCTTVAVVKIIVYIHSTLTIADFALVSFYGFLTFLRVVILVFIASLIWVPIGVWIGMRPRVAAAVQPLAQFLAAFPANLFFPIAVALIVKFQLAPDIWLSPLIVLGTQWYILFNVIAGAASLPSDLQEAADCFHIHGWQRWKILILPGIFPYYLTGAIAASGGSWNASIVAELIHWGDTTLMAKGLGSYIAEASVQGDYPRIVLGIAVMSVFVIFFNRFFWRKLSMFADQRLRLE